MTAAEFLKRVQAYYAKPNAKEPMVYNTEQVVRLNNYLSGFPGDTLDRLYEAVVDHYNGTWALPKVMDLHEVFPHIRKREEVNPNQITDDAGFTEEEMESALAKFRNIAGRVVEKRRFE